MNRAVCVEHAYRLENYSDKQIQRLAREIAMNSYRIGDAKWRSHAEAPRLMRSKAQKRGAQKGLEGR